MWPRPARDANCTGLAPRRSTVPVSSHRAPARRWRCCGRVSALSSRQRAPRPAPKGQRSRAPCRHRAGASRPTGSRAICPHRRQPRAWSTRCARTAPSRNIPGSASPRVRWARSCTPNCSASRSSRYRFRSVLIRRPKTTTAGSRSRAWWLRSARMRRCAFMPRSALRCAMRAGAGCSAASIAPRTASGA